MALLNDITLTKIIQDFINSTDRSDIIKCKQYYDGNVAIKDREFYYWGKNTNTEKRKKDNERSNVKINTDFLGIIVDQKIDYCLAQDIVIDVNPANIDVNDFMSDVGYETSLSSVGWLHFYINEKAELKEKVVETENIISLRDGSIEDNLTAIIRIYEISGVKYADYYDDDLKVTYMYDDNKYNILNKMNHGFTKIPFIPFFNNRTKQDDLVKIKSLIDAYDLVMSDFANNFIDFQELILFITNYSENASTGETARELMEWLKKYKLISIRKDGTLDIISREVPYLARMEFLQILKKNIFFSSRAVDMDELKGGSLTNVVIKAYFANLDMKANKFIKEAKKFIKLVYEFLNEFNSTKVDVNQINITFNKSLIISEKEIVEMLSLSGDLQISRQTLVENHPRVDDADEEMKRLDEDDQRGVDDLSEIDMNLEDEE